MSSVVPTSAWAVVAYSEAELCTALATTSGAEPDLVRSKQHVEYFREYFAKTGVRTILIERDYIDRDFLEDFAAYYVRCFHPYNRGCSRLHFFSEQFSEEEFALLLSGEGDDLRPRLEKSYQGFIVVKPLPRTIIGRTCLKTYPSDSDRRKFPITRRYGANLFGFELTIDTLAFQEQDRVAAACATSALWSAFQGTGILFQHHIPSPVEITRSATDHGMLDSRALPSGGLNTIQMANAIRQVNLEPLLIKVSVEWDLMGTAYAYVTGGVPALLLGQVVDASSALNPRVLGSHAIVVTGYSLGRTVATPEGPTGFVLRSSRIDKLYCHDDQVGPFARMEADGAKPVFSLSTSWRNDKGAPGSVRFVPQHLLVPLYHKVRIAYSSVLEDIISFDGLVQQLNALIGKPLPTFEWDVYLSNVNKLKSEMIGSKLVPEERRALLEASMPRFLWRAKARSVNGDELEILFDATGIELGHYCFRAIEMEKSIGDFIRNIWQANPTLRDNLRKHPSWRVTSLFVGP